ncbi:MAG: radical SAM protein [bacterium]|nr:MAG: radical SAM protein [bacterium]
MPSRPRKSSRSYPAYLDLIENGEFEQRCNELLAILESCTLCPRRCAVNRLEDERGTCGVGRKAVVSSVHPHFGEESPLVGRKGSGTVFFSGCNLKCLFCQNYEISQNASGVEVDAEGLSDIMRRIRHLGCHNLNLVTPTHIVPQVLEALEVAVGHGFDLPIVYNTGGYDSIEVIRLLDGIVDIYMPDIKYLSSEAAERYSKAPDYPDVIREVMREMHRQVGDLEIGTDGVAVRGLLVRHLVMPGLLEDTDRIMKFLADDISRDTYVNVMRQYHPCYRAYQFPPLDRSLSTTEWKDAVDMAKAAGLYRLDKPYF